MTQLEKSTMKLQTVAVVLVAVTGSLTTGLASFYSSKAAIQEGFNEVNTEVKLIKKDVSELQKADENQEKRMDKMEAAAISYLSKTPEYGTGTKTR